MKINILKSLLIWVLIIPLAILNGGFREFVMRPIIGNMALPISGIILAGLIFLISFIFLPKLKESEKNIYVKIGIFWMVLTIFFEFFIGFISNKPFSEIIMAYSFLNGNLWLLDVIFIGFVPFIIAKIKKII